MENTYIPNGGRTTKDLENQDLFKMLHILLFILLSKGNLSAQDLAGRLIEKGHQTNAVEANSGLTLLKFLLVYPQLLPVAFVFLISFLT